jgi:hypothetical protein
MAKLVSGLALLEAAPPSSVTMPDFVQGIASLPRGGITEILGDASSGRTALAHRMLATATLGGEVSAWIDCSDAFDPASAQTAGADLGKLLWVQCGRKLEVALKAADLVLHNGGFGLIVLDLCDASAAGLQRIPLPYWYRLRRAIEHTSSVLLVLGRDAVARSCAARQFELDRPRIEWRGFPPFQILGRLEMQAFSRKPMGSQAATLEVLGEPVEAV